jgi:hypothetical protein
MKKTIITLTNLPFTHKLTRQGSKDPGQPHAHALGTGTGAYLYQVHAHAAVQGPLRTVPIISAQS